MWKWEFLDTYSCTLCTPSWELTTLGVDRAHMYAFFPAKYKHSHAPMSRNSGGGFTTLLRKLHYCLIERVKIYLVGLQAMDCAGARLLSRKQGVRFFGIQGLGSEVQVERWKPGVVLKIAKSGQTGVGETKDDLICSVGCLINLVAIGCKCKRENGMENK
jgi:hypothetical protein